MIPVRNVYHMLAYVFHMLKDGAYVHCATERFENVSGLLAEILIKGISIQVKRGLQKNYSRYSEETSNVKGKLHIGESVRHLSFIKAALVCEYDIFDENCYQNKILKTTVTLLLTQNIAPEQKKKLRNLMFYFREVEVIEPNMIDWHQHYNRNNQSYQMLMYVCEMVIKGMLQTTDEGKLKLRSFIDDERLCHLYEKFILNYYRRHHPELRTSSEQIPWAISESEGTAFLPTMQTDVILRQGKRALIIDAKFYNNNLCSKYGGSKHLHSHNTYQIYTYVDNYRKLHPDEQVQGMLLYARTDAMLQPDTHTNAFCVRTLDLNADFTDIAAQLNEIASTFVTGA